MARRAETGEEDARAGNTGLLNLIAHAGPPIEEPVGRPPPRVTDLGQRRVARESRGLRPEPAAEGGGVGARLAERLAHLLPPLRELRHAVAAGRGDEVVELLLERPVIFTSVPSRMTFSNPRE